VTQEDIQEVDRMLNSGIKPSDVAKHFGVTRPTLHKRLLQEGFDIDRCETWRLRSVGQIAEEPITA